MLHRFLCLSTAWLVLEGLNCSSALSEVTKVERWLQLSQKSGTVTYQRDRQVQSAKVGDRLNSTGDSISTGKNSSAVLEIDSNIGVIQIGENTTVLVQRLATASDSGRITNLSVLRGRIRVKVRKFTVAGSQLEVETPGGVNGVRGTDFAVGVRPDGSASVATLEGKVASAAQGQEVLVDAGFQTRLIPGQPPLPPTPLLDDPRIQQRRVEVTRLLRVRLTGKVDPVNLVSINQQAIALDRQGYFDVTIPVPPNRRIETLVTTPLGKQQAYQTILP